MARKRRKRMQTWRVQQQRFSQKYPVCIICKVMPMTHRGMTCGICSRPSNEKRT